MWRPLFEVVDDVNWLGAGKRQLSGPLPYLSITMYKKLNK
jgi:hypothetical protein